MEYLTLQQKQDFLSNGYLIIRDFVANNICHALMDRAKQLITDFEPSDKKVIFSTRDQQHAEELYFLESGDKIRFFFEHLAFADDGRLQKNKFLAINKIGHALHDLDPVFNCFSRTHKIAALIKDLEVEDPLLVQSMYICKQPFIGGEVTCHQDSTYLFVEDEPAVGLWFALEDATIDNGCLWAIPGGHKNPLKSRFIREDNQTRTEIYDPSAWPLDKMIPLPVARGSVILLHGLLPHMSKENLSPHSRHAYTIHVMSGNRPYPDDNWLQRPAHMPFQGFM